MLAFATLLALMLGVLSIVACAPRLERRWMLPAARYAAIALIIAAYAVALAAPR